MYTISVHERGGETDSPNAAVSINGEGEYPITVRNPFSPQEEARLEWYFEQHLRFPFTEQVQAQAAAASVTAYGESLFNQVFADRKAYARYQEALQSGVENLRFEIAGSPEFHQLHWEALKDPELPQPLTLQAPMIRRTPKTQPLAAAAQTLPTINLLLVVARPDEGRDVGYRTISRPLVEMLRQSDLRVQVDFVRPGTYQQLVKDLEDAKEKHGTGYYHVVHFDAHGLNQLGLVTGAQQQWAHSRDYFLRALETFAEFRDEHSLMAVSGNLALVWRQSGDANLPSAVASRLGVTPGEVESLWHKMLEE